MKIPDHNLSIDEHYKRAIVSRELELQVLTHPRTKEAFDRLFDAIDTFLGLFDTKIDRDKDVGWHGSYKFNVDVPNYPGAGDFIKTDIALFIPTLDDEYYPMFLQHPKALLNYDGTYIEVHFEHSHHIEDEIEVEASCSIRCKVPTEDVQTLKDIGRLKYSLGYSSPGGYSLSC